MKGAVLFVLGAALGTGLGWWMAPEAPQGTAALAVEMPGAPAPVPMTPDRDPATGPRPAVDPPPADAAVDAPPEDDPAACPVCERERAELAARVDELEARLAPPAQNEPTLAAPPEARADRFTQDTLTDRFRQAFADTEVPGSVISVDCSEYPCIVYGELERHEHFDTLLAAEPLGRYYGDDGHLQNLYTRESVDAEGRKVYHHYFGATYHPRSEDTARRRAIRRRFESRVKRTVDELHPQ